MPLIKTGNKFYFCFVEKHILPPPNTQLMLKKEVSTDKKQKYFLLEKVGTVGIN
jgi:hypothetical protein